MVARRQIGYADAVIMGAVGLSGTALARRSSCGPTPAASLVLNHRAATVKRTVSGWRRRTAAATA